MKKILNSAIFQRVLKGAFVAALVAENNWLSTASAITFTVDFQCKPVVWDKCKDLKRFIKDHASKIKNDISLNNVADPKEPKDYVTKITNEEPLDGTKIVFKNGTLTRDESLNLFKYENDLFEIDFINCNGVLDVNENFRNHVKSLNFVNCKFTMAKNCFTKAPKLQAVRFRKTELTTVGNCLDNLFPVKLKMFACDPYSLVLPRKMRLQDARTGNNFETYMGEPEDISKETNVDVKIPKNQLSLLQKTLGEEPKTNNAEQEELIKRLEKTAESLKKVAEDEKSKRISTGENLRERLQDFSKRNQELQEKLKERKKEIDDLHEKLFEMEKALTQTENEKLKCSKEILNQKERNSELSSHSRAICTHNTRLKKQIEDLKSQNSQLSETNEVLEKKIETLEAKLQKQSETIKLAEETLKQHKKLKEEIRQLKDSSEKKSNQISNLNEQAKEKNKTIKEWELRYRTALDFTNYAHKLIVELKKRFSGVRDILHKCGYKKRIDQFNEAQENPDEFYKNKNKTKGQWIDFNKVFEQIDNNGDGNDEQEDETNDGCIHPKYFKRGGYQRGRGNYNSRGYRGGRGSERGYRGRRGYRGERGGGRGRGGTMMFNRGRGG